MTSWPSLSLTNQHDATFNNLSIIYNNNKLNIFDIFCTKQELQNVIGLAPATLDTLQEIAASIDNDPNFFYLCKYSIKFQKKH